MDMNDDTPTHDELDDLAVYALDAERSGERHGDRVVPARTAGCGAVEQELREAAGAYGAAGTADDEPPPDLRDRVLTAALAARPPGRPIGTPPVTATVALPSPGEVHRREQQRGLSYLRSLRPTTGRCRSIRPSWPGGRSTTSWRTWPPTPRCWPTRSACRSPACPRPPSTTRAAPRRRRRATTRCRRRLRSTSSRPPPAPSTRPWPRSRR